MKNADLCHCGGALKADSPTWAEAQHTGHHGVHLFHPLQHLCPPLALLAALGTGGAVLLNKLTGTCRRCTACGAAAHS